MQTKYLLPCPCGRQIPIETAQAGQTIRCQCGAELEVPRLMQMRSLSRAEPEPQQSERQSGWGVRQRLVLLGALVAIPGFVLATYLFLTRPRPAEVPTYAPLDALTFSETWNIWLDLRSGVERRPIGWELHYEHRLRANRQWMAVALAICGAGLLLMASSLLVPQPQRRQPKIQRNAPAQPTGAERRS